MGIKSRCAETEILTERSARPALSPLPSTRCGSPPARSRKIPEVLARKRARREFPPGEAR